MRAVIRFRFAAFAILAALLPVAAAGQRGGAATPAARTTPERIDYLTFAQGAVSAAIVVEGHRSSEGTEEGNRRVEMACR